MKLILLLLIMLGGLSGCQQEACPALAKLARADPIADAQAASARADHRLLILGGYVGVVPGAEGTSAPTRMLAGTSDVNTDECERMRPVAHRYAHAYYAAILSAKR